MIALTKKQEKVYDFLFHFFEENDQLPPMETIRDHFGWKSKNAAQHYIDKLFELGWIEYNAVGKYRFTRLL